MKAEPMFQFALDARLVCWTEGEMRHIGGWTLPQDAEPRTFEWKPTRHIGGWTAKQGKR